MWDEYLQTFKTLGDPVLESMRSEAVRLLDQIWPGGNKGRWLSLLGNPGVGKTFLANMVYEAFRRKAGRYENHVGVMQTRYSVFRKWHKVLERMRKRDYDDLTESAECFFVVLDDIGVENDRTGFAREQLFKYLDQRVNKWTIITCNLTLDGIAKHIDDRIADRMIRDENVCLQLDAPSYAMRRDPDHCETGRQRLTATERDLLPPNDPHERPAQQPENYEQH